VVADASEPAAVAAGVVVGGGFFKPADITGFVRGALSAGFFVLSSVLRFEFARGRAMLLSVTGLGIAGKPYYYC
jgi:hypothetical protein